MKDAAIARPNLSAPTQLHSRRQRGKDALPDDAVELAIAQAEAEDRAREESRREESERYNSSEWAKAA